MAGESAGPRFTRAPAPPLQRFLLRSTPALYRGLLADQLSRRCVMLLTTTGRRSGLPRTTAVSFMPHDGKFVVFSGWGVSSQWYRNAIANPNVQVQIGRRRMPATITLVTDPEWRRQLMLQMQARSRSCGPPLFIRPVLKALRIFDYEGEITMAVAQGGDLPVLEIVPK